MFDIHFIHKTKALKDEIVSGRIPASQAHELSTTLEDIRSAKPHIFNIETTNICNMTCVMCPRTTLMDRKLSTMTLEDFRNLLHQIRPHSENELLEFWKFIEESYDFNLSSPNENSFYFQIISRCITLHGYGEPLLDKNIVERVSEATAQNIPTYLSCVPANLTLERAENLMAAGLTVLKVSIDALSDEEQQKVRGPRNNFEKSFHTIHEVLRLKKDKGYKTLIVPTMIQFSDSEESQEKAKAFLTLWQGHDVFAYVKSQDNRWLFKQDDELQNKSHYAKQYCEAPWTSMTVAVDGTVVPCAQDYNVESDFGNIREQSLDEIWNADKYRQFREWHVTGNFPKGHKCLERCDQIKLFQYLKDA